jgi:integrase/recombinase XerD
MKSFQGITMSECTVQLWYNKQRVKKGDLVSLYLEIIVGGKHKAVKLNNLKWPVEKFDWQKKKLLPKVKGDPDLLTYNAIIERERNKYWDIVMNYVKEDKPFRMADILHGSALFRSGTTFCEFMTSAIIDRQKTLVKIDMIKGSTAEKHKGTVKKLLLFLNGRDVTIQQLDSDLLNNFANHLRKSVCENTVWMRIQQVKSYLSYAARHMVATNQDYKKCIVTMDEPDPVWLEEQELNALLDLYWENSLSVINQNNLRAFLFASFTGLRVSDLTRWNKNWIKGSFISFIPIKRRKSAKEPKPLLIPIIPIAEEFINDLNADSFELPSDQKYNDGLKKIAKIAGIKKNITSHVARHTFATWLAIEGVPVLVISKLLGHKNVQTTMIYIHIAEEYLATQTMKLQMRFGRSANVKKTLQRSNVS